MTTVVQLGPDDWPEHRMLLLEALRAAPDSFLPHHAETAQLDDARWRESLTGPAAYWHARDASGPLGMAELREVPDEGRDLTARLTSMYVRPLARRRSIGELLVGTVASEARSRGYDELVVYVATGNDVAERLFERTGFVATGRTVPHPHQSCLQGHAMVKRLSSDAGLPRGSA